MHLTYRNVNDAFRGLVEGIHKGTIPTSVAASRVGEVLQVDEPVIVTYEKPLECVLFNQARDANPFLHVYEALWMLAGRNDIAPLAYYSSNYAKQVQDGDSPYANGAYGYRWRHADTLSTTLRTDPFGLGTGLAKGEMPEVNQLQILIDHLCRNPFSRRAVLQMWTVEDDLLKIETSRDVACNTCVYFAVGRGVCSWCSGTGREPNEMDCVACIKCNGKPHEVPRYLNMTVCNRSNDLIWGMLGANVVHFSLLQEYMALSLGLEVGVYNQITNNLHVYTERWQPEKWLDCEEGEAKIRYYPEDVHFPLISDQATFDREVVEFVERHSRDAMAKHYDNAFLCCVAQPMCIAFHYYKRKDIDTAIMVADSIQADDWRIAAKEWLERRKAKYVRLPIQAGAD